MPDLNIDVRILNNGTVYQFDIAGFDSPSDLANAIEDFWLELNEDSGEKPPTCYWEIKGVSADSDYEWMCEGTDHNEWEWEWIELQANTNNSEGMLEAAFNLSVSPENVDEAYCGQFRDDAEFAESTFESIYGLEAMPSWVVVDWEATSVDLMMDYGESEGYYFRSM